MEDLKSNVEPATMQPTKQSVSTYLPPSDESLRKIKSSMSLSAVLNATSSTPPDSMSQTSEKNSYGPYDTSFDTTGVEEKPASPPATPPQMRYMSHHELHQESLRKTLEEEKARLRQEKKWKIKLERKEKAVPETAERTEANNATPEKESPPQQYTVPNAQPQIESLEPEQSEEPRQPKIIRLKFREHPPAESLAQIPAIATGLPVKRGRGRPRKLDPITGEPLAKKPLQLDGTAPPPSKRRKMSKGNAVKFVDDENTKVEDVPAHGDVAAAPPPSPLSGRRKRRASMEEPTIYPHIHRKQKVVSTGEEKAPRPTEREHGLGLTNLGSTCYVNVVVQLLAHTKPISDYFLACDFARAPKKPKAPSTVKSQCIRKTRESEKAMNELVKKLSGKLGEEFGALLRSLKYSEDDRKLGRKQESCIASNQFWAALCANLRRDGEPELDSNRLQDAHEFLVLLLQALSTESNPVVDGFTIAEIIDNCFAGAHCTTFECNNCHETTQREDKCLELELPICRTMPAGGRLQASSLEEHLGNYILSEEQDWAADSFTLSDGSTAPACPTCGVDKGRSMRHSIKPKGDYVCIELKRFLWEEGENKKVRGHVGFPMKDLDLGICAESALPTTTDADATGEPAVATTPPSTLYDLYAMLVHKGDKSTTGHYYAFAKEGEQWFKFDDKNVIPVTEVDVQTEEAYILMYEKKKANN
ncbi:hypothetical protein ABW19_dt0209813 [Dactylella cylindrospora]|nr:hypothetical protein ABW19_dt0209813 [Dactylella cylindrospora]